MVRLKRVVVGFSKFNEGSQYDKNSEIRYTGSVILEEGDENYKLIRKEILSVLKKAGVSKERAFDMFDAKVKQAPEHALNQTEVDPDLCRFFWSGSTSKPLITRKIDEDTVIKSKSADDVAQYGDSVFQVWGGDIINLQVKVRYFPKHKKLAVWPQHIHIVKDSDNKEDVSEGSESFNDMVELDSPSNTEKADVSDWEDEKPKTVVKKRASKKTPTKSEGDDGGWGDDEKPKKVVKKRATRKTSKPKPVKESEGDDDWGDDDKTVKESETSEEFSGWKE